MCLAVFPNSKPIILERPLIVYKSGFIENKKFYSSCKKYHYKVNKLYTCRNPFLIEKDPDNMYPSDWKECRIVTDIFQDDENLSYTQLVFSGKLQFIKTGFHFYKHSHRSKYQTWQFEIPAGAQVIFGIDQELGVTNKIKLLGLDRVL